MNNLTKSELDALLCKYGAREEYYKLELLDYYGSKKCDLHLKNGTINVYNDKVIKRYATLEFTEDDTVKLELDEFTEEEVDLQNFIENHIKEGNNYHTWNISREFDNLLEK